MAGLRLTMSDGTQSPMLGNLDLKDNKENSSTVEIPADTKIAKVSISSMFRSIRKVKLLDSAGDLINLFGSADETYLNEYGDLSSWHEATIPENEILIGFKVVKNGGLGGLALVTAEDF